MTERHELRWGGFAGLAFVVLALLGRFLPGNPPTVDDSDSTISGWLNDHRTTILFSALLWARRGRIGDLVRRGLRRGDPGAERAQ